MIGLPFGETPMRSAIIVLVVLLWPLSLSNAASASPFSLHGPFSQKRVEAQADPSPPPHGEAFSGCGRGRYRDQATHQCRGPADLH